jgi:hypothetical protein
VYLDLNRDGARQRGEPLARTDREGKWHFGGLDAGTYSVAVREPRGRSDATVGYGAQVAVAQGQITKDVLVRADWLGPGTPGVPGVGG